MDASRYAATANCQCIQWPIFSALSSGSPRPTLSTLVINRLAPFYNPVYDLPSFGDLFPSLASLSVMTAYDDVFSTEPRFQGSFVKFWEEAIQTRMLGSCSHSLTTLRLQGQADVGVVPKLDFSQANFPALEALSLQKILFNEETHVEDFIVRHPGTLRKLWLADCAIAVEDWDQGAPRQWSHIWKRFAWELKGLVLLIVRFDPLDENAFTTNSVGDYHSLGYIQPSSRPWQTYESCDQLLSYGHGDRMALNKLRRLVRWQAAEGQKCEG